MDSLTRAKHYARLLLQGGEDFDEALDIVSQTYDLNDQDSNSLHEYMGNLDV